MLGKLAMDFGYCENAIRYDRLTSFRRGMRSRGFSFEEVSDASLEKSIEVYGDPTDMFCKPVSRDVDGDRVEYLGPCQDRCPQCMEAYAAFRSAKWFARTNSAVQAMLDKDITPAFVTLVFPNVAFPGDKSEVDALRDKIFDYLWDKHYTAQLKRLKKRVDDNPEEFGNDYDVHVHAERLAQSFARANVDGEFQSLHCKPVVTRSENVYAVQGGEKRVVGKRSKTNFIDTDILVAGEFKPVLGKRCAKDKVQLPNYAYCRKVLQSLFKRLRKGGNFPQFRFKYLFFPEVGKTREVEGKGEIPGRIHFHGVFFLSPDSDGGLSDLKDALKWHWHALTGNLRFPELPPSAGKPYGEKWFDPVREAKQVSAYVAKYASKETLQGERIMASQGFKWTDAIGDIALANRALTDYTPTADDWTAEVEYQSPFPDRDVLTAEKGVTHWVGIDAPTMESAFQVQSRGAVRIPEFKKSKPVAVLLSRDAVLHPAQAVKCRVNGEAYSDVDKGLVRNYHWVPYSLFERWCLQPRHEKLEGLPDGNILARLDVAFSESEFQLQYGSGAGSLRDMHLQGVPEAVIRGKADGMVRMYARTLKDAVGYDALNAYPKRGMLRLVERMFSEVSR